MVEGVLVRWKNVLQVVGCHVGGEVGNVVVGGVGPIPGETAFDKRVYLQDHQDWVRQMLLREPRGNVIRSTNVLVPSSHPEAQMGYVVMESTEYPAMSGGNTICVATVLLETGILPMVEPFTDLVLESPAGLIRLHCECANGKVTSVRFTNQPAFVYHLEAAIDVPGLGRITVDVAWGGMAYVLVDAQSVGFTLHPSEARQLCELGERIKIAAAEQLPAVHPTNPEFPGITITEFTLPLTREDDARVGRNGVVVSPGRIDRCPCGTGTCARLAVLHARGEIEVGERFISESMIGSRFDCSIDAVTEVGGVPAVIPSVAGQAWITDLSQVGLDPTDPFPLGYTLSDTWMGQPE